MNSVVCVEVYEHEVMFHFGSKEELEKELSKRFEEDAVTKITERIHYDRIKGQTLGLGKGLILIYISDVPKDAEGFSVLAHEIFHAACFIMEDVGIRLSDPSDEAFAYLIQFLTKRILSILDMSDK